MLSPKEVVNKWVDAFNDGDVDMIISLYDMDLCQYFGQKKLKYYADFFSSSSSLCCGVI